MRKILSCMLLCLFVFTATISFALDKNSISGVPVFNQDAYDWSGICGPTASGEILAYWDKDFPNLFNGIPTGQIPDTSAGAKELIRALMTAEQWSGLTRPENMGPGIVKYTSGKSYTFTVTRKLRRGWSWQNIVDEIDAGRPVLLLSYVWYHYVCVVGYDQTNGSQIITVYWGHNPYVRSINLAQQRTTEMEIFLVVPQAYTPPPPPPPDEDSDNDGINDDIDECPNTPEGTEVDEVGCPIEVPPLPDDTDDDNDGVLDSIDRCPNTTQIGTYGVDIYGCSLYEVPTIPDYDSTNPLPVEQKCQVPPGTPYKSKSCGQTSMEMVLAYYQDRLPTEQGVKNIIDFLYRKYRDPIDGYNGTGTNPDKLLAVAKEFAGYTNSYKFSNWSVDQLKAQIDLGRPVVVSVYARYLPRIYSYAYGHAVVVVGYDANNIICNDPARPSLLWEKYPTTDFTRAFSYSGSRGVVVVP